MKNNGNDPYPPGARKDFTKMAVRLDTLSSQVIMLSRRIEELSSRLNRLEASENLQAAGIHHHADELEDFMMMPEGGMWHWISSSALLPRVATVCFALVIALLLRVLTDNHILNTQVGTFIGIGYSLGLIGAGWWLMSMKNPIGPVLPTCGALLLYSIILEAHIRFSAITTETAYVLLAVTIASLPLIGWYYGRLGLTCLGLLGGVVLAFVLDFPRPLFPALMALVLLANIMAAHAARHQPRCGWTRWFVYVGGLIGWLFWTVKLGVVFERQMEMPAFLAGAWFLPLLLGYVVTFIIMTSLAMLRDKSVQVFDQVVPTLNALLGFGAAWALSVSSHHSPLGLGIAAVILALVHLGIAYGYYRSGKMAGGGICAFTTAGALLLSLGVPAISGNLPLSLVAWVAIGLGLARLSTVCEVGEIRILSYFLPIAATITGVVAGLFTANTDRTIMAMAVALVLALASGFQYWWSRRNRLLCSAGLLATFDPRDRGAMALLLVCLANSFIGLRLVTSVLANGLGLGTDANLLSGIDSVIINMASMGLMALGVRSGNGEMLAAAALTAMIGAAKVFGHDLFNDHGIPLVISVFSSGLVAVAGSVTIGRWQRIKSKKETVHSKQPV